MKKQDTRQTLIIKRICDQLRFAASAVNVYCEKLTPDIFGKYRGSAESVNEEFYAMSSILSDSADAVATLADQLWSYAEQIEESEPEASAKLREKINTAVVAAELFEDISVAVYSHIQFSANMAVIDVAAMRRDAAGFLIKLRDAVSSISIN